MKLLDRLYEHGAELLDGGDIDYGIDCVSTINEYHDCFSDELKTISIEEDYIVDCSIPNTRYYDDIDILD